MADKVALKIKHSTMKSFCHFALPAMALLMLLVSTSDRYSGMAAAGGVFSPLKINRSNTDVVSIAESDLESEFMMDSEITRMLARTGSGTSYNSIKHRGPTYKCGRGQRYCLPPGNHPAPKEKSSPYKRNPYH